MKNLTFTVSMSDLGLEIRLPSTAFLRIFDQNNARFDLQNDELFFLLKKGQIKMIANDLELIPKLEFDKVVILNMAAYDLELEYLTQYLVNLAEEAGIILRDKAEPIKIPSNIEKACATSADEFLTALTAFGTPGLAYRFTQTLREEQKANWDTKTFTTTEDIVLKSVNEVGHFLYFAGTNSWLQLVDKEGRTIHELSVV